MAFTAPHDPRTAPEPYRSRYRGAEMPLPPDFQPVHSFDNGWMTVRDEQLAAWPRAPETIREQRAEYYGLVSHLDARIGDVLEALDDTGLSRRTIVVFASDNGLALGSHGLLGKQSLYEHSTRVPLIIAGPGLPVGESRALVALFDLFPTVARLCRLATPAGVEGVDLGPLWRGEVQSVREALYTAFDDTQRGVRDGRFKLIVYPKIGYEQLFDLQGTPSSSATSRATPPTPRPRAAAGPDGGRARGPGRSAPALGRAEGADGFRLPGGGTTSGRAPAGVGDREVLRAPPSGEAVATEPGRSARIASPLSCAEGGAPNCGSVFRSSGRRCPRRSPRHPL